MTSKTWLITGTSSGLGLSLAETALKAGHKVLATARNPAKAALENPQISELGGIWLELDVTKPDTSSRVAEYIKENAIGGVIDVVVNNAGYSLLGSIEDMTEEEIQSQFETNFFGTVRVLRGVLPYMRERRSGVVVNVGSSAGVFGWPACSMYSASKFALEGMIDPSGIGDMV